MDTCFCNVTEIAENREVFRILLKVNEMNEMNEMNETNEMNEMNE